MRRFDVITLLSVALATMPAIAISAGHAQEPIVRALDDFCLAAKRTPIQELSAIYEKSRLFAEGLAHLTELQGSVVQVDVREIGAGIDDDSEKIAFLEATLAVQLSGLTWISTAEHGRPGTDRYGTRFFSGDELFDDLTRLKTGDAITFDASLIMLWSDGFSIVAQQPCRWLGRITAIEDTPIASETVPR